MVTFFRNGLYFLRSRRSGVFFLFLVDVAGHSRNTASFLFRAFENHLHSVAFLCHLSLEF